MELEDLQGFPPKLEHPKPISSQNIPFQRENITELVESKNHDHGKVKTPVRLILTGFKSPLTNVACVCCSSLLGIEIAGEN